MRYFLRFTTLLFVINLSAGSIKLNSQDIISEYLDAWKKFHPSKALQEGMHSALFDFEDYSIENIEAWIKVNKSTLDKLGEKNIESADEIDSRMLKMHIKSELHYWTSQSPHTAQLTFYTGRLITRTKAILETDFILTNERLALLQQSLKAAEANLLASKTNLKNVSVEDLEKGLQDLDHAKRYFDSELIEKYHIIFGQSINNTSLATCKKIVTDVDQLISHVNNNIRPLSIESEEILGRDAYAALLNLYTDGPMTPENLSIMALKEIELVRNLIYDYSIAYLQKEYPKNIISQNRAEVIRKAFSDMENDAPLNGEEYLNFWIKLSTDASNFVKEKGIATLPVNETLQIVSAPESAGPAARIGWVDSAPPFAPNPVTTLYLPSIPDTLSAEEKRDFWSSFNKPFNRMIVIHELFPGHYMQNKIARESPHPVRLLFPYGPYSEGWATFCERVALDQGWEKENPLTLIAHLRKRLENANRAYTSVMVHCFNWNQERVMKFSTEQALLAPQFAKSLWGRLLRSPMQMTSYFLGGKQFQDLLELEKSRKGPEFVLKNFMDTILRAGPIPIDEFYSLFN
jgi:uncharacterized protein (DUF885 family)